MTALAPLLQAFFTDRLMTQCGASPHTVASYTRLAAIHSLFRYASLHAPEHANLIGRVLAIQTKRTTTTIVSFLDRAELEALLAAPDQTSWHGRRDGRSG